MGIGFYQKNPQLDTHKAYCGFSDKLKTAALRAAQKLQAE